MIRRVIVLLFPRYRYRASTTGAKYFMPDRPKLQKSMGGAVRIVTHTRVFDRSGSSVSLNFTPVQGSFGDEAPTDALNTFALATTAMLPDLPYNSTTMSSLPKDGTFTMLPTMGLVDMPAVVTADAATDWIEFAQWGTLEFDG